MQESRYLRILKNCVPAGLSLIDLGLEIRDNETQASIAEMVKKDLSDSHLLDWDAYLENNGDILRNNVNPVIHFIEYGMYEGRKLYKRNKWGINDIAGEMEVTFIITSYTYENAFKYINTIPDRLDLKSEFIFIIDDCLDIKAFKTGVGEKIKFLQIKDWSDIGRARKKAVSMARAKYIMLIDGNAHLKISVIREMLNQLKKGNDLVVARENTIKWESGPKTSNKIDQLTQTVESESALQINYYYDALNALFCRSAVASENIYYMGSRSLLKDVHDKIPEKFPSIIAYFYEFLWICIYGERICLIEGNITDTTLAADKEYCISMDLCLDGLYLALEKMENTLSILGKDGIFKKIQRFLINYILKKYLSCDIKHNSCFINILNEVFKTNFLIENIIESFGNNLINFIKAATENKPIRTIEKIEKIGLLYSRIDGGGIETTIRNICTLFKNSE